MTIAAAQVSPTAMEIVVFAMMALVFVTAVVIVMTVGIAFLRDRAKSRSEGHDEPRNGPES